MYVFLNERVAYRDGCCFGTGDVSMQWLGIGGCWLGAGGRNDIELLIQALMMTWALLLANVYLGLLLHTRYHAVSISVTL